MNAPSRRRLDAIIWTLSAAFLGVLLAAQADAAAPVQPNGATTWREECGSCHVAFPAELLPPRAWTTLLDGLDRHFGVDASLPPAQLAPVRAYLAGHAATGGRAATGVDARTPRITTSGWFRREHDEVAAAVWQRPAIRSAANCGACHAGAAQGRFDEDGVRIPK